MTFPTGTFPWSVVANDFNNDNVLDLAVANNDNDSLSVLIGMGNGNFRNQTMRKFRSADDIFNRQHSLHGSC